MRVLMARCTASTNLVSPGAAGGERRPSRQEAGHRGAGRRTLSRLASSMTYVTICRPPWRYTGTRDIPESPRRYGTLRPVSLYAREANFRVPPGVIYRGHVEQRIRT